MILGPPALSDACAVDFGPRPAIASLCLMPFPVPYPLPAKNLDF
jgi:hypothetical protein